MLWFEPAAQQFKEHAIQFITSPRALAHAKEVNLLDNCYAKKWKECWTVGTIASLIWQLPIILCKPASCRIAGSCNINLQRHSRFTTSGSQAALFAGQGNCKLRTTFVPEVTQMSLKTRNTYNSDSSIPIESYFSDTSWSYICPWFPGNQEDSELK